MAALSAWGLYRFNQILAAQPKAVGETLAEKMVSKAANSKVAFAMMYGEIFWITALVCMAGAVLGLLIGSNSISAEDPQDSAPEPAIAR
jgi:hypothetical protein